MRYFHGRALRRFRVVRWGGRHLVHAAMLLAWILPVGDLRAAGPSVPSLFSAPRNVAVATQSGGGSLIAERVAQSRADLRLIDQLPVDGSGQLRLNLFDDAAFTARFSHLDTVSTPSRAWWGTLEGERLGTFTLVRDDAGMAAIIRSPGKGEFEVQSDAGGNTVVRQIDSSGFKCSVADSKAGAPANQLQSAMRADAATPPGADSANSPWQKGTGNSQDRVLVSTGLDRLGASPLSPRASKAGPAPSLGPPAIYGCDDGTVIDIMVAYTAQARAAAGGTGSMNTKINMAIADTNAAFSNSLISTSLHLVYTYEVNYTETGSYVTDTNRYVNPSDGYLDDLPPLRDTYGADCISIWNDTYNLFGYGYYPDGSLQGVGASGLTLMDWRGYAGLLLAHEVGHNLWCAHQHGAGSATPFADYSYGYVEPGNAWMDIMASAPPPRIPYYANPNVNWPGPVPPNPGPTGVAVGNPNPSDIALTITQTRHIIANFRPTSVPGSPPVLYVKASASPGGNGQSWGTACRDLQDALCKAAGSGGAVQEIWVAAGTYKPDRGSGDRTAAFHLQNNLAVYGGFAGTETNLSQRDWVTHVAILSGDIGTAGSNADNSYHVVRGDDVDSTARLDGFTITAGNADSANYPDYDGGGMRLETATPTIANCTFSGNNAENVAGAVEFIDAANAAFISCTLSGNTSTGAGGGVHCYVSSPSFTNCTFSGNSSLYGGGMYNQNGSNPVMIGCTFSANTASDHAGGIRNDNSVSTLRNCTFVGNVAPAAGALYNGGTSPSFCANCRFFGNQATDFGGGAVESDNTSPTLVNCIFSGNQANWYGGALANYGAGSENLKVVNCTFSRNNAVIYGGGIAVDTAGPTLANTILWGNTDSFGSTEVSQIVRFGDVAVTFNHCSIQGWTGSGGGVANNPSNPLFTDSDGADNTLGTTDDNLRPGGGSPAIDTGDTAALPPDSADLDADANTAETTPLDLDGHPRVLSGVVDRGAYESVPVIPDDFDHDGDVDGTDLITFQTCRTGPKIPGPPAGCTVAQFSNADRDSDNDVDQADFARFQRCISGTGLPGSPTCAN